MACNCCKPSGCSCKVRTSDENAEVPTYQINPFSYGLLNSMRPWIHRDYPEPISEWVWNDKNSQYVASNALYDKDGKLIYYGDSSHYSRRGMPAYQDQGLGGWVVQDYNGDNSPNYLPGANVQNIPLTVFALEEKQDAIEKECQLWAKFRKVTYNPLIGYQLGQWSELQMIHSMKWDSPFVSQLIVEIPPEYFVGINAVELRYHCINPCLVHTNASTWELSGQADWINASTIQFPLDICKSYGKFDGKTEYIYKNCNGQGGLFDNVINNRATKILFGASNGCVGSSSINATFSGTTGFMCTEVIPCNNGFAGAQACCGNIFGGYVMQPDGTEICGFINGSPPACAFLSDPYNVDLIDSKTASFNGIWSSSPLNYTVNFDCLTRIGSTTPYGIYKLGSILITGV